jgi:broad specificity phosphatase PhoE
MPVSVEADLREVDVGMLEGLTWDELVAAQPGVAAAILASEINIDWPGGDAHMATRARAEAVIGRAAAIGRLVIVSHGLFVAALAAALGGQGAPVALAPGGAAKFVREGSAWRRVDRGPGRGTDTH